MERIEVRDFGLGNYEEILNLQNSLFETLISDKKNHHNSEETILIGEHPSVITLGRRAKIENILVADSLLSDRCIRIYKIGRGGDVTYHCQGQLIVYPILDLDYHKLGVKKYVELLEETVIRLLDKYGIKGERIEGATGVWIGKGSGKERKICAIGIKCSHFCTMHGLALNVNADLSGFNLINPCGFTNKGVTSMKEELGVEIDMGKIKREFLHIFLSLIFPFEEFLDFLE